MALIRKKQLLLPVALVLIVAAAGIWRAWNKPHPSAEDHTGIPVEAPALYASFANHTAARYEGQVLEVRGTAERVATNQDGKTVAELAAGAPMGVVQCTFREPVALRPGGPVAVKGFCNGFTEMDGLGGTVALNDCILVP